MQSLVKLYTVWHISISFKHESAGSKIDLFMFLGQVWKAIMEAIMVSQYLG